MFAMFGRPRLAIALLLFALCISCAHPPDRNTLVMVIESSPANLDPRIGTDSWSERIDMLLFDSLLKRDQHFNLQPSLAQSWEIADLLWNLSDGALGVVPYGSGPGFNLHPIGSGPFRFVSLQQDKEAVIERNPDYWDAARTPRVNRVRLVVVPDTTTRALELRKGS